jgi:hypothetical protein
MERATGIQPTMGPEDLRELVVAARRIADVESAAIFVLPASSDTLELASAAGIEGAPLERLEAAVRNAGHPIARTAADGTASFDVTPTAPGGPALRSHLPLIVEFEGEPQVLGVLAVAHNASLDEASRRSLDHLADQAADVLSRSRGRPTAD